MERKERGSKLHADIIESLLGLIFFHFGYKTTFSVGGELLLTLACCETHDNETSGNFVIPQQLRETLQRTTDYPSFQQPQLVEEALAHASSGNRKVSSYERLEWVGDAVICLATREWLWNNIPQLDVGTLVTMESVMVSNEVLAFLSVKSGLHHFLEHRDHTLPSRIESYICTVQEDRCGLWGTGKAHSEIQ